ncbi:MAG: hypothetical protein ACI8W8_001737, partial [Rhodothermales bacterium]
ADSKVLVRIEAGIGKTICALTTKSKMLSLDPVKHRLQCSPFPPN